MTEIFIDFDEIVADTLAQFQYYLTLTGSNIDVQRLTDRHYSSLANRDFPLNWSYIINDKLATDGSFDFGLTWRERGELVGAFISAYKLDDQSLEIYAIERLEQDVLEGNMMLYSLYACYLLLSLVDGKSIKAIDVEKDNQTLRAFYQSFGFKELNEQDLILTFDDLNALFETGDKNGN